MAKKEQYPLLAKRYATALHAVAEGKKKQAEVEKNLGDLTQLIAGNAVFASMLKNPTLSVKELISLVRAVADKVGFGDLTTDLLQVLARNKRLMLVNLIAEAYQHLALEAKGEMVAELVSAKKMTKADKDAIAASLSKKTGKKVTLKERVDEKLIAGFTVRVGSKMIDASVADRLERMRLYLQQPVLTN